MHFLPPKSESFINISGNASLWTGRKVRFSESAISSIFNRAAFRDPRCKDIKDIMYGYYWYFMQWESKTESPSELTPWRENDSCTLKHETGMKEISHRFPSLELDRHFEDAFRQNSEHAMLLNTGFLKWDRRESVKYLRKQAKSWNNQPPRWWCKCSIVNKREDEKEQKSWAGKWWWWSQLFLVEQWSKSPTERTNLENILTSIGLRLHWELPDDPYGDHDVIYKLWSGHQTKLALSVHAKRVV